MPLAAPLATALHDLVAAVDHRVRSWGSHPEGLRCAAAMLGEQGSLLRNGLAALQSDDGLLADVARHSYWHPNGFAKLVLHAEAAFALRMHIWPANMRPVMTAKWHREADENPHGHRWDFASLLLTGRLRESLFLESADARPGAAEYNRCDYGRENGVRYLRSVGTVWLRGIGNRTFRSGEVNVCPRTAIHTVGPVGAALVATVVVQGPCADEPTAVYLTKDLTPEERRQKETTVDDLRTLLGGVLARLG